MVQYPGNEGGVLWLASSMLATPPACLGFGHSPPLFQLGLTLPALELGQKLLGCCAPCKTAAIRVGAEAAEPQSGLSCSLLLLIQPQTARDGGGGQELQAPPEAQHQSSSSSYPGALPLNISAT